MRKIVVGVFVTLDGVMEGPGPGDGFKYAGWTTPYQDDQIMGVLSQNMFSSDAILLGRKTYEGYAAAFSSQTGGMADYLNNQRKYVVSTTLKKADWNNSVLINGNVADEIARLKQQSGKDITVTGSRTLIQTLIHHDLVDEYSLLVHPLSLGTGQRLFGDECRTTLKLVASQALSSGVLHLTYQPERKS